MFSKVKFLILSAQVIMGTASSKGSGAAEESAEAIEVSFASADEMIALPPSETNGAIEPSQQGKATASGPDDDTYTLIAKTGDAFTVDRSVVERIGLAMLQGVAEEGHEQKKEDIYLPLLTSEELQQIIEYCRDQSDTGFIVSADDEMLKRLAFVAEYLQMAPLLDSVAKKIAERLCETPLPLSTLYGRFFSHSYRVRLAIKLHLQPKQLFAIETLDELKVNVAQIKEWEDEPNLTLEGSGKRPDEPSGEVQGPGAEQLGDPTSSRCGGAAKMTSRVQRVALALLKLAHFSPGFWEKTLSPLFEQHRRRSGDLSSGLIRRFSEKLLRFNEGEIGEATVKDVQRVLTTRFQFWAYSQDSGLWAF